MAERYRLIDGKMVPHIAGEWIHDPIAETLICYSCDATADGIDEAVAAGWTDMNEDIDGLSWNFLGTCPDCAAEAARRRELF